MIFAYGLSPKFMVTPMHGSSMIVSVSCCHDQPIQHWCQFDIRRYRQRWCSGYPQTMQRNRPLWSIVFPAIRSLLIVRNWQLQILWTIVAFFVDDLDRHTQ